MVTSICVDEDDFKVDPDNGRLQLQHHFVQNPVATFDFLLDGAQDVFEEVTDLPEVVITLDGWYIVTIDARGYAAVQPVGIGSVVAASVSAQLRVNNVAVAGTETMCCTTSQGAPDSAQPAFQTQGTGSATRVLFLTAGQGLSIWAKRNADAGTVTSVKSDDDGRCRITATRISGV